MGWNGSGVYSLPALYFPEAPGNLVDSTRYNGTLNDISTGLNNALAKDGQNSATANLPMGGFKHTGASNASTTGEYVVYGQSLPSLAVTTLSVTDLTVTGTTVNGEVRTENRTGVATVTGGAYTTIFDLNDFTTNRCACKITLVCTENGAVNQHIYEFLVPRTSTTWSTPVQTAVAGVGSGGSQVQVQMSGGRYFQARGNDGILIVLVQGTRQYFYAA